MDKQIVLEGENKSVFSCEVDGTTYYGTAEDFTTENVGFANKITLLDNFTAPGNAEIKISSDCTLDLEGKSLTTKNQIIVNDGVTLILNDSKGDGQIISDIEPPAINFSSTCKAAIKVGSSTGENAEFIMNGGIITAGDNGVNLSGTAKATVNGGTIEANGNSCVYFLSGSKGSVFNMTGGTLITNSENRAAIQCNSGSLSDINLSGGKVIRTYTPLPLPPAAIYAPIVRKITISGTAELISVTTGIEIRAGELEMTGGKVTSTAEKYTLYPFGSGETNTGSAISVDQHNSQRNIKVTISGGELSGSVALSTANPQKNRNFGEPAETKSPKSGGETVDGKKVVGTVSIDITGGTFISTSKDTERKIISQKVPYTLNGEPQTVTQYTFTGKNAIFNADDRLDISISNATIDGDLATITDNRGIDTIAKPRTSQNGGYSVGEGITYVGISAAPKDYSNLISYTLDESGNGVVIPEGWNYLDGWKGMVNDKDGFSKIALYVNDKKVTLKDLKYDPVNRVFAIPKGIKAEWSGQFANGGGSYYLAEFAYDKDATAVTVSSEIAGAVINGGSSGILSDKVKKIEIDSNSVALAIKGNSLDNIILDGGGNDSLTGGGGADIFVYRAGEDIITDYTGEDIVNLDKFEPLINVDSISTAENNLVLNFGDKNKLAFAGFASLTAATTRPTEGVAIQSGRKTYVYTTYSVADMTNYNLNGVTLNSAVGAEFNAVNPFETIDGAAVGDKIKITGNDKDNYIIGSKQGGTLHGGAGDDTLEGGGGENIFVYTAGKDVIKNYAGSDKVSVDTSTITGTKIFGNRLTFTTARKDNALAFDSDDLLEKIFLTADDSFITRDGVVNASTLKLFSGTRGEINLAENTLYGGISSIDASAVKNQNLTLLGGAGGEFTFCAKNNKADVFVHKGGRDTVKNYEVGKDKISLESGLVDFSIADNNVTLRLSDNSELVLEGVAGAEVNLHDDAINGLNQYSKVVFAADGVLKDKVAATSVTLCAGAFANGYDATADKKVKNIYVADNVTSATSLTGNALNNVIDVSKVSIGGDSGFTIGGGLGNDKITGSGKADNFIYTGGKDVITNYGSGDSISIGDRDLSAANISKSKKGVVFKFSNKDALTVNSDEKLINIGGVSYSFDKNAIIKDGAASLTSNFSGAYALKDANITTIDGAAVQKNLTLKGMKNHDELLIAGGGKKARLQGMGGNDTLQGGAGADTFLYSKGESGNVVIADFESGKDRIKINGNHVIKEISTSGNLKFMMTNGATVELDDKNISDVLLKANNTYYWFETDRFMDTGGEMRKNVWITSTDKISNNAAKNSGYAIIELGYSTNLVKGGLAYKSNEISFASKS